MWMPLVQSNGNGCSIMLVIVVSFIDSCISGLVLIFQEIVDGCVWDTAAVLIETVSVCINGNSDGFLLEHGSNILMALLIIETL